MPVPKFPLKAEQVVLVPVYDRQSAEDSIQPAPLVKHPLKAELQAESEVIVAVVGQTEFEQTLLTLSQMHGLTNIVPFA